MKMENDGGAAIECARCREREWWPAGKRGMRWSRCWCVEEMVDLIVRRRFAQMQVRGGGARSCDGARKTSFHGG